MFFQNIIQDIFDVLSAEDPQSGLAARDKMIFIMLSLATSAMSPNSESQRIERILWQQV